MYYNLSKAVRNSATESVAIYANSFEIQNYWSLQKEIPIYRSQNFFIVHTFQRLGTQTPKWVHISLDFLFLINHYLTEFSYSRLFFRTISQLQ